MLRKVSSDFRTILVFDEIYTGFGRTGRWFACEHWNVQPDLVCLGKALTGGFPLSACVGRADLMDAAWPASTGEAIHTSMFLGHPVGCAMALAQIRELRDRHLVEHSAAIGTWLLDRLRQVRAPAGYRVYARGLGLWAGLEVRLANEQPATAKVLQVLKEMLLAGFVLLPEGEWANVISFTPPLSVTKTQLNRTIDALETLLGLSRTQTKSPRAGRRRP